MAGNPKREHTFPCGKKLYCTQNKLHEFIKVHQRICPNCKPERDAGICSVVTSIKRTDFDGINYRAVDRKTDLPLVGSRIQYRVE